MEVQASKVGLTVVKPPVLSGRSGVSHVVSFLASGGSTNFGFDVYESLSDVDVLRSFIKQVDTKATIQLVCKQGKASAEAEKLAAEYGMKILTEGDIPSYFQSLALRRGAEVPVREQRTTSAA